MLRRQTPTAERTVTPGQAAGQKKRSAEELRLEDEAAQSTARMAHTMGSERRPSAHLCWPARRVMAALVSTLPCGQAQLAIVTSRNRGPTSGLEGFCIPQAYVVRRRAMEALVRALRGAYRRARGGTFGLRHGRTARAQGKIQARPRPGHARPKSLPLARDDADEAGRDEEQALVQPNEEQDGHSSKLLRWASRGAFLGGTTRHT
jgi:hypothetical protein